MAAPILSLLRLGWCGKRGPRHGFMAGDGDTHGRPDSEISAKMGGGLLRSVKVDLDGK
jgi:hypothetical protein